MDNGYKIAVAQKHDISDWMKLVKIVKDNFPGLVIDQYRETLNKNIDRQSAICVRHQNEIVGILLFSIEQQCLSCMAIHPDHRKKGLASALIGKMISLFPKDSEIWVTTFRKNDPNGDAPRALYKKLGFVEDELVIEFGYPCQKFVLKRV